MSQFAEAHSISKIVGAPPGYVGYLDSRNILEEIRNKPFSVLILDEIEKAHPSIINLLFQIFDESKLKDSKGTEVRFDNVIVIMTSNIGFMDNNIGFSHNINKIVEEKLKENFSVPLINRIDTIVSFNRLTEENIIKIINNNIRRLKEKYKAKNINVIIGKNVISQILQMCNYKEFGARKIKKIIKEKLENQIIERVLNKGNRVVISTVNEMTNMF